MASDTTADSEWEYNCPQYVDFTAPLSDENADDWFGKNVTHRSTSN